MVSSQEPVPTGVFASDQYMPSAHYEEWEQTGDGPPTLGSRADRPLAPSNPKVIDLDKDLVAELDPLAD